LFCSRKYLVFKVKENGADNVEIRVVTGGGEILAGA
jgi:hypothetical protein